MSFALIIFIRVLFVACMVFILGYIFGSFGKRPVLKTISRIAAILVIVLFIAMNILFVRAAIGGWHHRYGQECPFNSPENEAGPERKPDGTGLDQKRGSTGQDTLGHTDAGEGRIRHDAYLTSVWVSQTFQK